MAEKNSLSNWAAFEKAGLFPIEVTCEGYLPIHTRNNGCHTRLLVRKRGEDGKFVDTADSIIAHINADHGSREFGCGFLVKFRRTEGKPWGGWAQLREAKIEVQDFRCDHCGDVVALRPGDILSHMKPHSGKIKKSVVKDLFWMSLNFDRPLMDPNENEFSDLG